MGRDDLQAMREAMEPPWDDLREKRVLRSVRSARTRRLRTRQRARWALACAAALAVLGVLVGVGYEIRSEGPVATEATPAASAGSVLSLADGSRLSVQPNADVEVEVQTAAEVRLAQRAGEVLYEVPTNPLRRFEVRAAGVRIRVKGTAFRVRVASEAVVVRVERGRVVVEDASGAAELGAGEELRRAIRAAEPGPPSIAVSDLPEVTAPTPSSSAGPSPSVEELLARADSARAAGRHDEAASALQQILGTYPKDKRIGTVLFTLGRVERARGNHAAAAAHFRSCSRGSLAEDALAEEAASWQAAGQAGQARDAATRYLQRFPDGPHVARMQRIAR